MKILFAFDFDDTIITENSDYAVLRVLPVGTEIPKEIQDLYHTNGWMKYMGAIFAFIKQMGCTKEDILACMESLSLMPGFTELMTFLGRNDADIIIISDSNSIFIEHILQKKDLKALVKEVFTNTAEFDEDGLLKVWGYHKQTSCKLSTENLCKGQILEEFLKKQEAQGVKYDKVAYVGDGSNDYCPALRLTSEDIVFPRKDFRLDLKIKADCEKIKATVIEWESGYDIIEYLKKIYPSEI